MQSRYAQRIKLGIIGPASSGKTHLLHTYLGSDLETTPISPTVAVQFYERVINIHDTTVALRIWDSSGHQKFQPIVPYHLKQCQAIILMYDLTSPKSLQQLQQLLDYLEKEQFDLKSKKLLVLGTKADLFRAGYTQQISQQELAFILTNHDLPTDRMHKVTTLNPSGEMVNRITKMVDALIISILQEREMEQIENRKIKLGINGIAVTQPTENQSEVFCGGKKQKYQFMEEGQERSRGAPICSNIDLGGCHVPESHCGQCTIF